MCSWGWRRLLAFVVDVTVFWLWLGLLFGLVQLGGQEWLPGGFLARQLVYDLLTLAPLVLLQAGQEARWGATLGKRLLRVRVLADPDGRPTFRQALVRNLVKIAPPWALGHVAGAWGMSGGSGSTPWWVVVATVGAYGIALWWVVAVFTAGGRTPYDRLAGTEVVVV